MSRHPFIEWSERYMESMEGYYSPATAKRYAARFRRMNIEFVSHYENGSITTSSPKSMTAEDVAFHLRYRKAKGLSASEYGHEVTQLIVLFDYCENPAVRTCLRKYPLLKPRNKHVRLGSMSPEEYTLIVEGCRSAASSDDYRIVRSFAMLGVFLGCGPRTKELRLIEASDLDTSDWILSIVHVKGEDSYGQPRDVPVPPVFRSVLSSYLRMRPGFNPGRSPALFPPSRGDSKYLSGNSVREILGIALSELGIHTDPRTLRRTFGQAYLDAGIDSIESVSVLMGHNTTQTTELFYARRRNSRAIEEARKTFADPLPGANPGDEGDTKNDSQRIENEGTGAGNGLHILSVPASDFSFFSRISSAFRALSICFTVIASTMTGSVVYPGPSRDLQSTGYTGYRS